MGTDKRIAISIGKDRMTVVTKNSEGQVQIVHYTWWHDGMSLVSRSSWRAISWDKRPRDFEHVEQHDSVQSLQRALSFEAGCEVKL